MKRFAQQPFLPVATIVLLAGAGVLARFVGVVPPLFVLRVGLAAVALLVTALATLGAGGALLRLVARRVPRDADDLLLVPASGAVVLIAIAAVLGGVGLLHRTLLVVLLAAATGWGLVEAACWWSRRSDVPAVPRPALALLAPLGLVIVAACATESAFYDQLHYHLAFPYQWLRAGGIVTFPRQAYSFLPQNLGLLYVWALSAGGAVAAQAVHAFCGVLAALGAARLAVRLVPCARREAAGWWAAALLATSPMVLLTATWAASDLGVAAFGAAAFLCAVRATEVDGFDARLLRVALAGLFAGVAAGVKLVGFVGVGLPAGLLVIGLPLVGGVRRGAGRAAAGGALYAGTLAAAFAPWAIRNAVATGNPLHPYFASWFGATGAGVPASRIGGTSIDLAGLWRVPTLGAFAPEGAAGVVGAAFPVVLAAALAWLVLGAGDGARRRGALLFAALLAGVAAWSVLEPLGRYLAPQLVIAAGLGGAAIGGLEGSGRPARAARTTAWSVVLLAMLWGLPAGFDAVTWRRVSTAFGHGPADGEMQRGASYLAAVPYIRDELPAGARLLMVAEVRTYGIDREPVVEDPFETPFLLELAAQRPGGEALAAELRGRGITHVLFNAAEASRIARLNGREDYWDAGDETARATVFSFWKRCLDQRFREGQVAVYELVPCRPAEDDAPR